MMTQYLMIPLLIVTCAALLVSFVLNRKKTLLALKKGLMMLVKNIFPFFTVLIAVSIVMVFVQEDTIKNLLGARSGAWGIIVAALVGSVSLIPGFIAFPLCAILLATGVEYAVIAVFLTTLMMVGVVTLPLEAGFFGWKAALVRNSLSLCAAIVIGLVVGVLWRVL